MIRNFITYVIGLAVIGGLLIGLINVIAEYLPFVMAGIICVTPFYGAYRKMHPLGQKKAHGLRWYNSHLKVIHSLNRDSIAFYAVLGFVVYFAHKELALIFAKALVVTIMGVMLLWAMWEVTRVILKATKKVEIVSFGEAIRGAF